MKWMYLLPLLLTAVLCEKRLTLRNIERDNLRSEYRGKKSATSEQLRADESKYSAKAEVAQQYYAPTASTAASAGVAAAAPQELGNQAGDYAELQSYESFKYAPGHQQQDYNQGNEYPSAYLQQSQLASSAGEQQHQQQQQQEQHTPQQYYIQEGRSHSQNDYEVQHQQQQQQQQLYQQEVLVGNQLQSVQQKAAAQKYADASEDKGIYYINIPMSQLLAYYQNYGIVQSKSKNAEQQVSLPVYTPTLTQNQVYAPTKVAYQPKAQYVSTYPKYTQAVIKKSPSLLPVSHATPAATATAPVHQVPTTSHQQYTAPMEILVAPSNSPSYQPQRYQYVTEQQSQQPRHYAHHYQHQHQPEKQEQQQQQQQQIVYENAQNSYQDDAYNEPSTAYEQDNFLYEQQQQQQQYQTLSKHQQQFETLPKHQLQFETLSKHHQQFEILPKQQQHYTKPGVDEKLTSQLSYHTNLYNSIETAHPHSIHNIKQQQQPAEPIEPLYTGFVPPQYQASMFRPSQEITHLLPIPNENENVPSKSTYSSASYSQPKSLLDSYVPSHVIAAQDSHRYRERPIKLESGFLPSKINFLGYKKRKTE